MKLHSLQIIPGVHFPDTAIVDVMLQPDPEVQSFKHVRCGLIEFFPYFAALEDKSSVLLALVAWAEGLQSRVEGST